MGEISIWLSSGGTDRNTDQARLLSMDEPLPLWLAVGGGEGSGQMS